MKAKQLKDLDWAIEQGQSVVGTLESASQTTLDLQQELEADIEGKSDNWKESERGEAAQAQLDQVTEIHDKIQEAVDALGELEGLRGGIEE